MDANWVITAAHCIEGADDYTRYGMDIYVAVGDNLYTSSGVDEFVLVSNMTPHPDYSTRDLSHDIGVLELSGRGASATPIPMNTDSIRSSTHAGVDLTYVGWGISDDRGDGSGIKRTVDVPIYEVYG
ncbi:MAG: trypsin-like serine protease, partial [bacterium]